jgi:ABC-2 type transport system ATP-binding protein
MTGIHLESDLESDMEGTRMSATVARFDRVAKRYGKVTALDGVSFELRAGETVALLGPNGAGKSTTVGLLLGLHDPSDGRVAVLGGEPRAAVAAGRVGAMLQQGALLEGVTVRELVGFVRELHPRPAPLDAVLERAGLTGVAGRRVDRLSGGQAQRVRFAMAIAGGAELLFLDEPTVGMDVETRRAFWASLREEAAGGTTVLFATHYLEEADAVADRILVLMGGRIVADGPATAIKARFGSRRIRATIPGVDDGALRALPGVLDLQRHGDAVTLECNDADATLRALFTSGVEIRDVEVTGAGLEDAFLALTGAGAAR